MPGWFYASVPPTDNGDTWRLAIGMGRLCSRSLRRMSQKHRCSPSRSPTVRANSGVCRDKRIISELESAAPEVNPLYHSCFLWQLTSLTWANITSEQDGVGPQPGAQHSNYSNPRLRMSKIHREGYSRAENKHEHGWTPSLNPWGLVLGLLPANRK